METAMEQTKAQERAVELSTEAFAAFCNDISGMFGVEMSCSYTSTTTCTPGDIKKHFGKLTAVNLVQSDGLLDGTFQLIFDQAGMFILSGIIVMLPENRIMEEVKRGTIKDIESMNDAIGETGNLLVGSWDRIFREEFEGHGHFIQSGKFIGTPWDDTKGKIGLDTTEHVTLVLHEIKVDDYPAFNCGVIYPESLFEDTSDSQVEQQCPAVEMQDTEEAQPEVVHIDNDMPFNNNNDAEVSVESTSAPAEKNISINTNDSPVPLQTQQAGEPASIFALSGIRAEQIMDRNVIWCTPDSSVSQVIGRMWQHCSGYVMIGDNQVLEGIVSNSNLNSAISIYLRPSFAKWRTAQDEATLNIKVKWIMSRPVRTVSADTPLTVVIDNIRRYGVRCLPVVDRQGKIQGQITIFDILAVLDEQPGCSKGNSLQMFPVIQELHNDTLQNAPN